MNKAKMLAELLTELSKPTFEGVSTGQLAQEIYRRCRKGESIKITNKGVRVTHSEFIEDLQTAAAVDQALSRFAL